MILHRSAAVLALLLAAGEPSDAAAQHDHSYPPQARGPGWTGHATAAGANALLGGLTAGGLQKLRGGSFQDGFTRGLLGGTVVYAGKRVAAERFDGAGLLGREIAAVGASVVRNAGEGRPALERITLPLGAARLEVRTGAEAGVGARIDAHGVFWMLYGVLDPNLTFDAGASLSSGATVFRAPNQRLHLAGQTAVGMAFPGTIFLGGPHPDGTGRAAETFAHERVHIIQHDQAFLFWDEPLQRALAPRVPGVRTVYSVADVDLVFSGVAVLGALLLPHPQRPWEAEALLLTRP
jgi:hypothetical protein